MGVKWKHRGLLSLLYVHCTTLYSFVLLWSYVVHTGVGSVVVFTYSLNVFSPPAVWQQFNLLLGLNLYFYNYIFLGPTEFFPFNRHTVRLFSHVNTEGNITQRVHLQ